jgi:hypothetical protein
MKMKIMRVQKVSVTSFILGIIFVLTCTINPFKLFAQEEGGVTGADFLTSIPVARTNAMGGALDGLDYYLEAIYINPAVYAPIDRLSFLFTIQPYPNDVTNSQLSFGMPLLGGVVAASAQFLNTGGFTYINEFFQPEDSVNVYDAAASFGYSRYVWDELSVGLNLKAIYRTLGEYNAFAVGGDVGSAYWFETPHVGQRPKPPTDKQLEKEYNTRISAIEKEREKRVSDANEQIEELEKSIASLDKDISDISAKIDSAEGEKQQTLIAKRDEMKKSLTELQTHLAAEQENSRDELDVIDKWYKGELQTAEEAYSKKLADLRYVESERTRLFSLINEPEKELTEEMINASIDEDIDKTRDFFIDRSESLNSQKDAFIEIRKQRIDEISEEIVEYVQKIDEETGPEISNLQEKLNSLEAEKQELENSEAEDTKDRIQALNKQISETEKELEAAKSDPWIKRLDKRVEDKKKEIDELNEAITAKNEEIIKTIEELKKTVRKETEDFNIIREDLNRELKKAKLKRELDLLKANKESRKDKAIATYEGKENKIYTGLLSAKYTTEEKLINTQVDTLKEDFENRRYDLETQFQKERERIEEEFAFQDRYLSKKISDQQKKVKSDEGGEAAANELAALEEEIKTKESAYKAELNELEKKQKQLLADEQSEYEKSMEELEWQKKLTRLIYLQTDDPYRNTSVHASLTNFGSKVKFVQEGYPLPTAAHVGAGYAVLNTNKHTVRLGVQLDIPFHDELALGVGAEYGFLHMVFVRAGYTFLTPYKSFSAGAGALIPVGFTNFSVDYTFQPIPDYGFVHTFGISAYF